MTQVVQFKRGPEGREIRPKSGAAPFTIYEQTGYIIDRETGEMQDAKFRVDNASGYKPGTYVAEPPKLLRGDFNSAAWERRIRLREAVEDKQSKAVGGN